MLSLCARKKTHQMSAKKKEDLIKIGSVNIVRTMVEIVCWKKKREEISFAKHFVLKHSYNTNTWNVSVKRSMFSEYPQIQRIICYYSSFILVQFVLRFYSFFFTHRWKYAHLLTSFRLDLVWFSFYSRFILFIFPSACLAAFFVISFESTCLWMCTNITCKNNATSCSRIYYLSCECAHFLSFYIKIEQTQNERKKSNQQQNRESIFFFALSEISVFASCIRIGFWG